MNDIVLDLSPDLLERLQAIARDKDLSLQQCALEAVQEYLVSWEDFARTKDILETGEDERLVLRATIR
jgi:predicted transcriptional regulator